MEYNFDYASIINAESEPINIMDIPDEVESSYDWYRDSYLSTIHYVALMLGISEEILNMPYNLSCMEYLK